MKNSVISILGPTAVGKTALACALYERYPVDIISVDSAMVYQGMDIGTGKPTSSELQCYPHHLVNIRSIANTYNVAEFCQDADALIQQSLACGRVPVLVGGTMLYFHALQCGIDKLPASDTKVRALLNAKREQYGQAALYQELQQLDPSAAQRLAANDTQRVQRALEVHYMQGAALTSLYAQEQKPTRSYNFINIMITEERAVLREKIARRFDAMLSQGLEDEVRALWQQASDRNLSAWRAVGYRQMLAYILGESSYDEMRERAIIATCQLAKRQFTWLRSFAKKDLLQYTYTAEDAKQQLFNFMEENYLS